MVKKILNFSLLLTASLLLFSCNDDTEETQPGGDFDRQAMLIDVADKLIIPGFLELQSEVGELHSATLAFTSSPNYETLDELRRTWRDAVIDHQHCAPYGFGPADLNLGPYFEVLGVFPVDEALIEENILKPDFDLPNSFDTDIRGFYTVEYLIYREGLTDQEVIDSFDQNRKDYLLLIVSDLKNTVDSIVAEWTSSYREVFIQNSGTADGSSVSLYYNEFIKVYEVLKNYKLELPAGLSAGQEHADGTLVEAYYSGISSDLIVEHWENSKNIWFGRTRNGQDIIGFEEYLQFVEGGPVLINQTKDAIAKIDQAMTDLPQGRLSDNLEAIEVEILRDELQNNTANFKSSMSSLLGIDITFSSGDGD